MPECRTCPRQCRQGTQRCCKRDCRRPSSNIPGGHAHPPRLMHRLCFQMCMLLWSTYVNELAMDAQICTLGQALLSTSLIVVIPRRTCGAVLKLSFHKWMITVMDCSSSCPWRPIGLRCLQGAKCSIWQCLSYFGAGHCPLKMRVSDLHRLTGSCWHPAAPFFYASGTSHLICRRCVHPCVKPFQVLA